MSSKLGLVSACLLGCSVAKGLVVGVLADLPGRLVALLGVD